MGNVKTITVPVSQLENAMENGVWFDGSSIQGFVRISESDMFLRPDLSTFAIIPWLNSTHGTARFVCDVFTPNGETFVGAPRTMLSKAMAEAREMGFEYRVGPELEFFLFETDETGTPIPGATHDEAGYFDQTADRGALVRDDMITALEPFGIDVEAGHHEVANGQHEIDFRYGHALTTADAAVTFKYVLKAIAQQHNVYATFMPKPIRGINGSGMHVHQSLPTPVPVPTCSTMAATSTVSRSWPSTLSPVSSRMPEAWRRCSHPWSTHTSVWCPAMRPLCTSPGHE